MGQFGYVKPKKRATTFVSMLVGMLDEIEFHMASAAESSGRIEAGPQRGGKEPIWSATGG